jgi:Zn-dependent protease
LDLPQIALFAVPIIIAITFHEAAHGFAARHFGDDTAARAGRLTLNPLKHIDPVGTVLLPALLLVTTGLVFGWAKPVPVNANALRNPRYDMIWVAIAGPGMNLLLATASALGLAVLAQLASGRIPWLENALVLSVELNFVLALFNMLPVPPLDGSKVLAGLLPDALLHPYLRLERYGFAILLALLFLLPYLGKQLGTDLNIFRWLISNPAEWLTRELFSLFGLFVR